MNPASSPVLKVCRCGRSYTAYSWKLLRRVGSQADWVNKLELRQCVCETTLAVCKRQYMREIMSTVALRDLLKRRAGYGGKKGRSADRRLAMMGAS